MSLPTLAATLSFVTYTLTAHNFSTAIIFASFSLFQVGHLVMGDVIFCIDHHLYQILRQPMMFMPRALSAIPDASSALQRLSHVFHAELRDDETLVIDKTQEHAVIVRNATFEWESSEKIDEKIPDISSRGGRGGAQGGRGGGRGKRNGRAAKSQDKEEPVKSGPVFRVRNVSLTIPRGQLAAIVGPVGSGKVSHISSFHLWISSEVCLHTVKSLAGYHR